MISPPQLEARGDTSARFYFSPAAAVSLLQRSGSVCSWVDRVIQVRAR